MIRIRIPNADLDPADKNEYGSGSESVTLNISKENISQNGRNMILNHIPLLRTAELESAMNCCECELLVYLFISAVNSCVPLEKVVSVSPVNSCELPAKLFLDLL
jgi:hypothetical protein